MNNVVNFGDREALVWACASCGCTTFKLYEGGTTECASCELQGSDDGEWISQLPEPCGPIKTALPDNKVISFGDLSPAVALRVMMKRVDAENLVALIALETNGLVRTWGGVNTADGVEWIEHRLAEAKDLLTNLAPNSED